MTPPVTDPEAREALEREVGWLCRELRRTYDYSPGSGAALRPVALNPNGRGAADLLEGMCTTIATLTARVEALKETLRKIADHPESYRSDLGSYDVGWAFYAVQEIARAALNKDALDARA